MEAAILAESTPRSQGAFRVGAAYPGHQLSGAAPFTHPICVVGVPGRVPAGGGSREYVPVGLATASLLSTPPPAATRPSCYSAKRDRR